MSKIHWSGRLEEPGFLAEMLGLSSGHRPRYAKLYADLRSAIDYAARRFAEEVATGAYPDAAHSYDWSIKA